MSQSKSHFLFMFEQRLTDLIDAAAIDILLRTAEDPARFITHAVNARTSMEEQLAGWPEHIFDAVVASNYEYPGDAVFTEIWQDVLRRVDWYIGQYPIAAVPARRLCMLMGAFPDYIAAEYYPAYDQPTPDTPYDAVIVSNLNSMYGMTTEVA